MPSRVLLLAATALTACASTAPTPAPRDEACLEALRDSGLPTVPEVPGFTVDRRSPRATVFDWGQGAPDTERLAAFHHTVFRTIHERHPGVQSTGTGLCPDHRQGEAACIRVALLVCRGDAPAEVARTYAELWQAAGHGDAPFRLGIELAGRTAPRCKEGCGPQPVSGAVYDPWAARRPVLGHLASEPCARDGECLVTGCGNRCVHWTSSRTISTCEGYDELDAGAFCGCVDGGCRWFVQ